VEILLDRLFLLHADDAKTNVCVPFQVEREFGSLEFVCVYGPKGYDDEAAAILMIEEGLRRFVPEEYRESLEGLDQFLPSVTSLVTLSIDYGGRYLGCAHRHAPEQRHIVSAHFSSPGFLKQPVLAGDWRAVINVHSVVSRELRYRLRVLARERSEPV
jgi:hypothetical protein